jgi:CRISPR-associated endonuclease Csn1
MSTTLGLDVGANSIGWCLIEDGKRIIDLGVRIFADGRDAKSGTSLAVDRRIARGMRRRRDRYLRRRSAFLSALVQYGLLPADADEARLLTAHDPYLLRAAALDHPLDLPRVGRALFHLNQRRGFKSNRKADRQRKEGEDGKIEAGAKALDAAMAKAGARTLGEFLAARPTRRVRMGGENQAYDFYPQRRHIEAEFEAIWAAQSRYHPTVMTPQAREALHRILFFQRPLKAPEVGVCTFVPEERRLPKAHPLFQERRLYEEVNQLEITTPGEPSRKLSLEERDRLVLKLKGVRSASFTSLARLLKLAPDQSFNKASETRTKLAGDETFAAMSDKAVFGPRWATLDPDRQWVVLERLINEEDPNSLAAFLTEEGGVEEDRIAAIDKAARNLPEGYGRLGPTATRRVLEALKADVITYDEAVRRAFPGAHHSDFRTGEILERLPYYGELLSREIPPGTQNPDDPPEIRWGKITNPTVHIGLRQLEKVINALLARHGRPDHIVVELARELKQSEAQREEHKRRIRRDTAEAERNSADLIEAGIPDTGSNRALLRAWKELNPANPLDRRCPYCGEPIGMQQVFGGAADIDHIIPFSRCLDDGASNRVLAHRNCNRQKGARTPFEAWGSDPERWEVISQQVSRLHRSKQWRFSPDAISRIEAEGGFLARHLADTQYLARLTARYLASLYPTTESGSVYVIPGRMTAMLRRVWGLNSLLPDHNFVENAHSGAPKNRLDHRHHAIDAAVAAVTSRRTLMAIARAAGRAEEKGLDRLLEELEAPWPEFRAELRDRLEQVVVSHKPDHGRRSRPAPGRDVTAAKLHDDTAYGLTGEVGADGESPIVVKRVPFSSLTPADIQDSARIRDGALQRALQQATGGLSGSAFAEAMTRFQKTHPHFKGVRRVRVLGERPGTPSLKVISIHDASGRAYKAYKGNANARFQVWALPDGRWVHRTISQFQAHQRDLPPQRPHPAARKVLDLRQNDLVAIERDGGGREITRVVKFSEGGQVTLAPHHEAGALKARDASPDDPFKYVSPTAGGLKRMKARQVRVDPIGRVFDPGPRD